MLIQFQYFDIWTCYKIMCASVYQEGTMKNKPCY